MPLEQPGIDDLGGWPSVLNRLLDGHSLTADEARTVLDAVLDGTATPPVIAAFLVALRAKGETAEEIRGLADAMVAHAETVPIDPSGLIDTCGTGGDRHGTINVSTVAALVAAGAGARVCKHGNRAASSDCGSADVLEALGVIIDADAAAVAACIEEAGIGFCFAPRFHPAMRHVGPIRRELGVPTVFNFLGPLANPAGVRRQVLGVSDPTMAERIAQVLATRRAERAFVVHGADGLDELTTTGLSEVLEVVDGEISRWAVDPERLGLRRATLHELKGGDAAHNAAVTRRVLDGEPGAHRDVVVLNAAAALVVAGLATDLAGGVEAATVALDDGRAAAALDRLVATSRSAGGAA
jgi:anthranilate phosphoribosyltransferase